MISLPIVPLLESPPEQLIAQAIVPDVEHPTGTVVSPDAATLNITGGTPAGNNLFHSFEQFGLSQAQTANFILANPNIQNVLSRVVGGEVSLIDGILQVTGGDANLFLMNPSGVIFGPNAQLTLPANLTVTTADGILLGDTLLGEQWFNAVGSNDYATLVGTPSGFGFVTPSDAGVAGGPLGGIANAGNLSLQSGDLVLVGDTVINTGEISADGGRLIITTVPNENLVRLQSAGGVLNLEIQPLSENRPIVDSGGGVGAGISPTDLPTLLTGGGEDPIIAFAENPDGTVQIQALDVSAGRGDVVTTALKAGVVGAIADGDIVSTDVRSTGGAISLISQTGSIDTHRGQITSGDAATNTPGDTITLHAFEEITTGHITSNGGEIQLSGSPPPCSGRRCRNVQGSPIDTTAGIINSTAPDGTGANVTIQAVGDLSTGDILSGGGDITLRSGTQLIRGGEIDTRQGTLDARGADSASEVRLHADGDIQTADVYSSGGIRLESTRGEIDTTEGSLNASAAINMESQVVLTAAQAVKIAPIFSDGAAVEIESGSDQAIARSGVIDTTSATGQDGNLTFEESTLVPESVAPDNIVLGSGQFSYIHSPDDGPSPGLAPAAPPAPTLGLSLESVPESVTPIPGPNPPPVPEPNPPSVPGPNPPPVPEPNPNPDITDPQEPQEPQEPQVDSVSSADLAADPSTACAPGRAPMGEGATRPIQTGLTEPNQIIQCYQRVIAHTQNPKLRAIALSDLGEIQYTLGHYRAAETAFEAYLSLAKTGADPLGQQQALKGIAATHMARGHYDQAIAYYQASLELSQARPELAAALFNHLGLVYYAQKNYAEAQSTFRQSLELAQQTQDLATEAAALSHLGQVDYALTHYEQAIAQQQQSLAIAQALDDPIQLGRTLENLGLAYYALEDYGQAVDAHQHSLKMAQQTGDRHGQARALSNLGDALYKAGDAQAAIDHLQAAIAIWESLRSNLGNQDLDRIAIFETQETTYSTLQQVLVEAGQPEAALAVTERGRARAFVNLLSREAEDLPSQDAEDLPSQGTTGLTQVDKAAPDLAQIKQIAQAQQSTLVSYTVVQEISDADGVRVLQDAALYIWVVSPTGEISFRQSSLAGLKAQGSSLSELVSNARCLANTLRCQKRNQSQPNASNRLQYQALQQLHQLLIEPIADVLPSDPTAQVTFIPHQSLFHVPFAALQNQAGAYLVESHTISTAPSIQTLELTRQSQPPAGLDALSQDDVLIVGNPVMPVNPRQPVGNAHPLPALLTSELEANTIADLLKSKALTGGQATEPAITQRMSQAKIIHLATHGFLDDLEGGGIPGAIALAPTANSDGLLTAKEIFDLELNADLVVLSACDTGGGRITGDGVVGLSRSLMSAGAPSVLVSLWQVPEGSDRGSSTVDLMVSFYAALENKMTKAQALRQAMLSTMQHYPEPEYWAAFTLIGEGD